MCINKLALYWKFKRQSINLNRWTVGAYIYLLLLYKEITWASTLHHALAPENLAAHESPPRPRPLKYRCPVVAAPKPRLPPHIPLETDASEHRGDFSLEAVA
jgi:hypothetical protein